MASLPFTNPALWPHGLLKCSSYPHFKNSPNVVVLTVLIMSILNSTIYSFHSCDFYILYSREVCDFRRIFKCVEKNTVWQRYMLTLTVLLWMVHFIKVWTACNESEKISSSLACRLNLWELVFLLGKFKRMFTQAPALFHDTWNERLHNVQNNAERENNFSDLICWLMPVNCRACAKMSIWLWLYAFFTLFSHCS